MIIGRIGSPGSPGAIGSPGSPPRLAGRAAGARALAAAVLMGALGPLGAGCTVGDGNGLARGPIFFLGCGTKGENFGTMAAPKIFDLSPHFFAGEPIEDISIANKANRLLMRIQRNGNRIEVNDTLYMDVQNAYEVARCVRGKTENGVPQYDTRTTISTFTGQPTSTPWCDWSGTPAASDGGVAGDSSDAAPTDAGAVAAADAGVGPALGRHARIHLGTEEIVRASLSLLYTCHLANTVGMAFDGWIDFEDFGGAAQPDIPPDERNAIPTDFKVNFGDRLRATFEVTLNDQRIVSAIKDKRSIPDPLIGGVLDGFFDYDLERGRAAQPFP
jgi:hypothetical protein